MKATKTEIIRLARLAQKDIASGRVSKNAQQAVEVLADYQNSAIELLELALDEAAKEQSNKPLVDSLGFLFSKAVETLRFDIESGYKTASDLAEHLRRLLVSASQTGASDPSTLLFLIQCFGSAKIDLGEDLRGVVEHLLEEVGEANAGDVNLADPAELLGFVSDLVKQANGDAFALFSVLAESSEGVPDEHRAIMAAALFIQGRIKGIERPALGSIVPTQDGFAYFLDVGANVDSKPEYLVQFASMGSIYAREMLGRANPRVGLLSNGEEDGKGDELVKETSKRLKESLKGFVGNIEPKDLYASKADVVVADGFVSASELCTGPYVSACKEAGISG